MSLIPCAIVLYPTKKLSELADKKHKDLQAQGSLATTGNYDAHLSLYLLQLDTNNIEEVENILNEFASSNRVVSLSAKTVRQGGGWVDVEYTRNNIIDDIQLNVIKNINPLRSGLREKDKKTIGTATFSQLENLQKWGYRNTGDEFIPHVTLARFKDKDIHVKIDINLHGFDDQFTSIGMFEMGDYGICVRKFFEIPLLM